MIDGLSGKVAIVTGGTRGIGAAIVRRLLEAGCEVATCGRNPPETLEQVSGRHASFTSCDVRDAAQVRSFVDQVAAAHGRLDILVNNAGGSPPTAAATASPHFSEAIIALNLLGPLHMSQAAYPHLKASHGSIVNIASVSAARPSPGTAVYGAAKAGLLSLTASLAQEWGPEVRVNAIIAGLIETDATGEIYGSDATQSRIAASLPLRRLGRGADIADAVLFLGSPLAAYVSGAELAVHGGGERPFFLELLKEETAP
jgi:NAD(P)-dependent dehydrogenase (short-subunit alcohol dehydrogenase family)